MRYTLRRMEDHVRSLVTSKGMNDWPVGGGGLMSADADQFCPELRLADRDRRWRAMPANHPLKAQHKKELLIGELTAFCFKCYEAAYNATGQQVIGRFHDLLQLGVYQQVANMLPQHPVVQLPAATRPTARNLFQAGARGNALLMDKWATMMNDAWILGGMHRDADFRLESPKSLENLWNQAGNYPIVTGREILGLSAFGYELQLIGAQQQQVFVQKTRKSHFVTLLDYEDLIERKGTRRNAIAMADPATIKPAIDNWHSGTEMGTVIAQIFHIQQANTRPAAHQQNLNAVFNQLPNRVN